MIETNTPKNVHHGRNLKRIREMMGVKQEALAALLGGEWHQKKVSNLEQKEVIEPELIDQLAKVLRVPTDLFKNPTEEFTSYNVQNNYEGSNASTGKIEFIHNNQCTFNPLDKYVESVEEIKRLNEENKKLYEALLKSERDKIALLEKMLGR